MPIFVENFSWMVFNVILAFVPVVLVVVLRQKLTRFAYIFIFLIWLLFLPNTIYLVSDLQHMGPQLLRAPVSEQAILIVQYVTLAVLGVMTYVYALEPVSNIFNRLKIRRPNQNLLYIVIHYLVGFGVILGKVQRTHSWYVFTQPVRAISDMIDTLTSPELMVWVFIAGTIINIIFFLFRDYFPPLRRAHHKTSSKRILMK